jgi:Putative DNA-binding domain
LLNSKTTIQQIDAWRAAKSETEGLEFKAAKKNYNFEKLLQYCVAIANERGGFLLLGIENKPPRPVVGTVAFANTNKISEDIFNKLQFRVDVEEVEHPGGRVLVFHIPSRPVGNAYHLEGSYYMRIGESLKPMSPEQLKQIHREVPSGRVEVLIAPAALAIILIIGLVSLGYWKITTRNHPVETHGTTDGVTAQVTPSANSGLPTPSQPTPPPRSFLVFEGGPRLPEALVEGQPTSKERNFQIGDYFSFNVYYRQEGPNPVQLNEMAYMAYFQPDAESATQESMISSFMKMLREGRAKLPPRKNPLPTITQGAERFITAFGANEQNQKWVLQQINLDDMKSGAKIAFVVAQLTYTDSGKTHHLRECTWLQPPATLPGVWHSCELFNNSD